MDLLAGTTIKLGEKYYTKVASVTVLTITVLTAA